MSELQTAIRQLEKYLSSKKNCRIDISTYFKIDDNYKELVVEYNDSPRRGLSIKVCMRSHCATVHGDEHRANSIGDAFTISTRITNGAKPILETVSADEPILEAAKLAFSHAFGMGGHRGGNVSITRITEFRKTLLKEALIRHLEASAVDKWNASPSEEKNWAGINLSRAILTDKDLNGIELDGLELDLACFDGSDLTEANFEKSGITKASFRKCDLTDADLSSAVAEEADFSEANLTDLRAFDSIFKNANFKKSDLSGARFVRADVSGADFSEADLSTTYMESCIFDEKTVFPPSRAEGKRMIWEGKGSNPLISAICSNVRCDSVEDLLGCLVEHLDGERIGKALAMLKAEKFELFSEVSDLGLTGIVKSQTNRELIYACSLDSDGHFSCCTQNLNTCGGLKGQLCKHIFVLIVGLCKADRLDPTQAARWCITSTDAKPRTDKAMMTSLFLRYKGMESGEIDWRPTETIPEDYYAF